MNTHSTHDNFHSPFVRDQYILLTETKAFHVLFNTTRNVFLRCSLSIPPTAIVVKHCCPNQCLYLPSYLPSYPHTLIPTLIPSLHNCHSSSVFFTDNLITSLGRKRSSTWGKMICWVFYRILRQLRMTFPRCHSTDIPHYLQHVPHHLFKE